jgi:hypothetical protein
MRRGSRASPCAPWTTAWTRIPPRGVGRWGSRSDLLTGIVDRVLAEMRPADPTSMDWREWLRQTARPLAALRIGAYRLPVSAQGSVTSRLLQRPVDRDQLYVQVS